MIATSTRGTIEAAAWNSALGERGKRPDPSALAGMARITACGRPFVISTP